MLDWIFFFPLVLFPWNAAHVNLLFTIEVLNTVKYSIWNIFKKKRKVRGHR